MERMERNLGRYYWHSVYLHLSKKYNRTTVKPYTIFSHNLAVINISRCALRCEELAKTESVFCAFNGKRSRLAMMWFITSSSAETESDKYKKERITQSIASMIFELWGLSLRTHTHTHKQMVVVWHTSHNDQQYPVEVRYRWSEGLVVSPLGLSPATAQYFVDSWVSVESRLKHSLLLNCYY